MLYWRQINNKHQSLRFITKDEESDRPGPLASTMKTEAVMSLCIAAPTYDQAVEVSSDIFTAWHEVPTAWEIA